METKSTPVAATRGRRSRVMLPLASWRARPAARRARGRVLLEASGNLTIERLPRVAATGVDFVSMGAVTHSARAADVSFEIEPAGGPRPAV